MNRYKTQGWKNDNYRHSLAARGYRVSMLGKKSQMLNFANEKERLQLQNIAMKQRTDALDKEINWTKKETARLKQQREQGELDHDTEAQYDEDQKAFDKYIYENAPVYDLGNNDEETEALSQRYPEVYSDFLKMSQHDLDIMNGKNKKQSSVQGRDAFAALDHRKFHKIQAKGSRTLQSV